MAHASVVKDNRGTITEQMTTSLTTVAGYLAQHGLITDQKHSDAISVTGQGPDQKAADILDAVLKKIKLKPHKYFPEFITALRESDLGDLADVLEEELCNTSTSAVPTSAPQGEGRGKGLSGGGSESKPKAVTAGEKFDASNVSYFLKKVKFPTEKWNDLAESLRLGGIVNTIEGDGGDNRKKLGRVVTHWCANDSDASWQKLVEAVSDCDELIKAKKLAEQVGADPPEED